MSAQQSTDETISVEDFRLGARAWLKDNVRRLAPGEIQRTLGSDLTDEEELAEVAKERALQRKLFDGGYAGICVPKAYGGQGLTPAHQRAFNDELAGYEYPSRVQVPTFNPLMSVILEFGTEEQKLEHVPPMLRGEAIWMQFLSEPSGGSDVAGALTTAVRDGDEWILNGSKIWTTGAWWSDWGLCLARTNWDVPKHRGLTVFMLPIHQESIEINRIEMLNGSKEFCQEYMTDTRVPDSHRIGAVDDGWTVGTKWMFFEKMLYNSPYVTVPAGVARGSSTDSMVRLARDAGRLGDPLARDLIGEARTLDLVGRELQLRVGTGIRTGKLPEQSAAVARLYSGISVARARTAAYEIAGGIGAAWSDEEDGATAGAGVDFMMRQSGCIGGGTTEMARNVISERILGMPRELSKDRDVAFRDVPRGPTNRP